MTKYFTIFILFCIVISTVSCTNSNRNDTISKKKDVNVTESFMGFIDRFHSDSVFAMSRLCDQILGYNSDSKRYDYTSDEFVADTLWKNEDIPYYLYEINEFKNSSEVITDVDSTHYPICEHMFIPESSCYIDLIFVLKSNKWHLRDIYYVFE